MKTPEIYVSRIGIIRDIMREKGIDAVIIAGSDPHSSEYPAERWKQVQWVCGFTGEAGDVVITLDHAGLWTDTRYFIQAVEQLEGTGVELHKTRIPGEIRIPQWLAEYAFEGDVRHVTVAVDGLAQTVDSVENLKNAFRKAGRIEMGDGDNSFSIIDLPDMLENVWIDRPSVPSTEIYRLPDEVAGESRQSRLQWLRDFIDENNCSAMLVTALDEIVWLLNVRASDVAYNPVALSYLLVTWDKAVWYVDKAGEKSPVTAETYAELEEDGVEIRSYDAVFEELASPEALNFTALYVDPSTLNWHLSRVLDGISDQIRLVMGASPVPLRKSVKNTVEIEGMRSAHFEDGIVMENFLFWLEKTVSSGAVIDEWDAACKLDSMRAAVPGCKGNSFETISAYGPGAALPHYVTPHTGSAVLEPHGLYLCDSGGQYCNGTTDITRTVPLGPCTELEMEDYTLVLRGHIGLAMAVFPAGTAGCQVDYAARFPLWQFERDFGHGTGHGVGFCLNVHEGPQEIRHNFNSQPLLAGMITSDEPGIYREGMHGVRHESLLLCVDTDVNEFGSWRAFENLTLCHIDTSAILPDLMTDEEIAWLNAYNADVYRRLSPSLSPEIAEWLRVKTAPVSR